MIIKPHRWRRVGVAALAGVSLALTALAAQVSPPNVQAVESTEKQGGEANKERVAIKLPAATLDKYVGSYKLTEQVFIDVKRDGEQLLAKVTGQSWAEIFPESDGHFFWKIVDAQLVFSNDGTGSAVLHQHGQDMPMTKVTSSESQQAQAAIDERIANKTAAPGTEAALKHHLDSFATGNIDYDRMEPALSNVFHQQESQAKALRAQLGAVQSIKFVGVGGMGWDIYDVTFEHGSLQYRISLADNGKMAGMMAVALP